MTIKQLISFSYIYETGNMCLAAKKLYISPQALNHNLSILEKELGMPLFIRSNKGMAPTELGTILYSSSRSVIQNMDTLEKQINDYIREKFPFLHIGVCAATRYLSASTTYASFCNCYPHFTIDAKEYRYVDGFTALNNNTIDMLIYSDCLVSPKYEIINLRTWPRAVLVPKGHRFYNRETLSPSELAGETVLLSANYLIIEKLNDYWKKHNSQPKEIKNFSDTLYMYNTCQQDCCVGIIIAGIFTDAYFPHMKDVRCIPFSIDDFSYTVSAIFRKSNPQYKMLVNLSNYLKEFLSSV